LLFTHALTRAAVYEGIGPAARAELHRWAARLTSGADALSHLASATPGTDAALASAFQGQAQSAIKAGSWRLAATDLLTAARLTSPGDHRDALVLQAVEALLLAGDLATALGYIDEIASMPKGPHRLEVQGRLAWLGGHFHEAERFTAEAWSMAEAFDRVERGRLAGMLAQMTMMQGDNLGAIKWAGQARRSGLLDASTESSVLATWAAAMAAEGRSDEAMKQLPIDGDLEDIGYRELVGVRGILHLLTDDPSSAVDCFHIRLRTDTHPSPSRSPLEMLSATGPEGIEPNKLIIMGLLAEAEYRRGNWDVAATVSEQAVALVEDTEQLWIAPLTQSIATLVPAARGQWKLAEFYLTQAKTGLRAFRDDLNRGYVHNAAIHLAACQGKPEKVIAEAQWLLKQAGPYHQEPGLHAWPVNYAAALVALDRFEEADRVLGEWEALAQERGRHSRLAALARVRGEMASRQRELSAARVAFAAADQFGSGVSDRLENALLLRSRGTFLRRRGERRQATADLQRAERILVELGAQPFLIDVRKELQACGAPPAPKLDHRSDFTVLTPQETAVAHLVIAGRSNQEIAAELFISPKTVAYHLSHVYQKLGLRSRTQLAAWRPSNRAPSSR
jgi:DNA-binding CsgD family transcriptional regulator